MLKHIQQSFVVETKRRRGRSTTSDARPREDAFSAAVRAFSREIESLDGPISDFAPNTLGTETLPVKLTGRILPSLVEESTTDKATQYKAARTHAKPGLRANSEKATRAPSCIAALSKSPDEGHEATVFAATAKDKKAARASLSLRPRAMPGLDVQAADAPLPAKLERSGATSVTQASRSPSRRGLILRRYVHRTELGPGERWKQRSRKAHR
jgi:hypothetical protein